MAIDAEFDAQMRFCTRYCESVLAFQSAIALVVVRARRKRNMSQSDLARKMGCPRSYVSKLECGRTLPDLLTILRLGEALETPAWNLFRNAEDKVA